jgi:hypothetical protein
VNYTGNSTATLLYKPVANQFGSATITVTVQDDGGTADGRADTVTRSFTVNVNSVNDPPSFEIGCGIACNLPTDDEDPVTHGPPGQKTIPHFIQNIKLGPSNESGTVIFTVTNNNPGLFTTPPRIDASGSLIFQRRPNTHGTNTMKIVLSDGGDGMNASQEVSVSFNCPKPHKLHNAAEAGQRNGRDVTGTTSAQPDGFIVAGDALAVINYINAHGSGSVNVSTSFGPPYPDVDGDDQVVAGDALAIVNYINSGNAAEGEAAAVPSNSDSLLTDLIALLAYDAASSQAKRRRIGG